LFAATTSLRVVLANHFQQLPELRGMLTSAAALLAVLLDFMVSIQIIESPYPCNVSVLCVSHATRCTSNVRTPLLFYLLT
jgi:hypothetical protein